jgi:hypothetical protein
MAQVSIWFGIALIALGVIGYTATGAESLTALIPAVFGLALLILGIVGRDPGKRKMAMHLAVAVGLSGFLGSVRGLTRIGAVLAGEPVERANAVIAQSIMAVLTLVFVALCVRSFINARRSRTVQ